ncbi:MAG: glycosyltransferase family 4 protein [Sedimentisphaerales bacterium]|nr:glycosyltransferase family 4 protein [Sedimentisphaerales bacterium]
MKIALITENITPSRGGAERSVNEMALALIQKGHDVTLIAGRETEDPNRGPTDQTPTQAFPFIMLNVTGVTRHSWWHHFQHAVNQHLTQNHYDIVHSMAPLMNVDVYQPRGGSILHSAQRQAVAHENIFKVIFKRATLRFNTARQARIAAESDIACDPKGPIVAALSQYVARQFIDLYRIEPNRLRLIRNGIAIDRLRSQQAQTDGATLRRQFDPKSDKAIFLFAAENLLLKGLTPLIRAVARAAQIRDENPKSTRDFCVLVAGSIEYRPWWKMARRLGQDNRVLFIGKTAQMSALYNMADAVVLPNFNDACSRVVMESLAVSKPVITTTFNGAAQFFSHKKHGLLLTPNYNTDELAQAILGICDSARQQSMAQAIEADQLYQQVSIERHATELIKLYKDCLQKKA